MYVVLEYLPVGRRLYALGANPRMAELVGIPRAAIHRRQLHRLGRVVWRRRRDSRRAACRPGQPDIGSSYMLPAFVGALLGATSFTPGRVNVPGTVVSVLLLAVGIAGLQQLGSQFYVQYLFNGATLALAVGLAGLPRGAGRRGCGRRVWPSPSLRRRRLGPDKK